MLNRPFLYIGLLLALWQPRAANANESAMDDVDDREGGIQAVTVTARRVEEDSQHVPVAVTVVSGSQLQDHGLFTTESLGQLAPDLTVTQAFGSRDLAYFNIRGQLFGVVNYFDEVPITNPQPGSIKPRAGLNEWRAIGMFSSATSVCNGARARRHAAGLSPTNRWKSLDMCD